MATEISDRVRELAERRGISESAVLEQALERGLDALWEELVLARYLNDEIGRTRAVELVGRDRVRRAEREVESVEDDVRWGLST